MEAKPRRICPFYLIDLCSLGNGCVLSHDAPKNSESCNSDLFENLGGDVKSNSLFNGTTCPKTSDEDTCPKTSDNDTCRNDEDGCSTLFDDVICRTSFGDLTCSKTGPNYFNLSKVYTSTIVPPDPPDEWIKKEENKRSLDDESLRSMFPFSEISSNSILSVTDQCGDIRFQPYNQMLPPKLSASQPVEMVPVFQRTFFPPTVDRNIFPVHLTQNRLHYPQMTMPGMFQPRFMNGPVPMPMPVPTPMPMPMSVPMPTKMPMPVPTPVPTLMPVPTPMVQPPPPPTREEIPDEKNEVPERVVPNKAIRSRMPIKNLPPRFLRANSERISQSQRQNNNRSNDESGNDNPSFNLSVRPKINIFEEHEKFIRKHSQAQASEKETPSSLSNTSVTPASFRPLRRPFTLTQYYCYPCRKMIPFLTSSGMCPFCGQDFIEDRETACQSIPEAPTIVKHARPINKVFFCHNCKKDLHKVKDNLSCPNCFSFFIEEKTETFESDDMGAVYKKERVEISDIFGKVFFCYNCNKDIHSIHSDLLCIHCGSSFVEEKVDEMPPHSVRTKIEFQNSNSENFLDLPYRNDEVEGESQAFDGCKGFAWVPPQHLMQSFLKKKDKFKGLVDPNPYNHLAVADSMSEFPKLTPSTKKLDFSSLNSVRPPQPVPVAQYAVPVEIKPDYEEDAFSDFDLNSSESEDSSSDEEPQTGGTSKRLSRAQKRRIRRREVMKERKKQEAKKKLEKELAKKLEQEKQQVGTLTLKAKRDELKAQREEEGKAALEKFNQELKKPTEKFQNKTDDHKSAEVKATNAKEMPESPKQCPDTNHSSAVPSSESAKQNMIFNTAKTTSVNTFTNPNANNSSLPTKEPKSSDLPKELGDLGMPDCKTKKPDIPWHYKDLGLRPTDPIVDVIIEAHNCLNERKFEKAKDLFSFAVGNAKKEEPHCQKSSRPLIHKLLTFRAQAQLEMGSIEEAEHDASRAIVLNPKQALPFLIRAKSRWLQGFRSEALADTKSAFQIDPNCDNPFS